MLSWFFFNSGPPFAFPPFKCYYVATVSLTSHSCLPDQKIMKREKRDSLPPAFFVYSSGKNVAQIVGDCPALMLSLWLKAAYYAVQACLPGLLIRSSHDAVVLQCDLSRLSKWSEKWPAQFIISKCIILNVNIGQIAKKDFGILVSFDLWSRKQCITAKNWVNRILGFTDKYITKRSTEVIHRLYMAIVRPHLDYTSQFLSPFNTMNIDLYREGWQKLFNE